MTTTTFSGMRDTARRLAQLTGAAACAALIAACGGGGDGPPATPTLPGFTTQPADQSVVEGSAATFTVVATGTAPLSYQWSSSPDGVSYTAVAGATSAGYATPATTLAMSGTRYRVLVTNSAGNATSSAATLTITAAVVAPAITVQPSATTVTAPAAATFNVTATGTTPTYQWQVSTDAGVSYTTIAGANAATLSITPTTTALSGYRYRVLVSNSAGNILSTGAVLTVNPTPIAPTITAQPAARSIMAGQAADFTVAAAGTPAPTIQWRLNGTNLVNGAMAAGICSGATVAGATTATVTLTVVPLACNGAVFSAVASNGVAPDATSTGATLTVTAVPAPPVITAQPAALAVLTDDTATFTVTATGAGLSYQWKKNGTTIVGATAAAYTTPAVTWVDSGALYTVVVTNADGSVTSNPAALNLMASTDQTTAHAFSSAGSYQIVWNLNSAGGQTAGTNYASYDFSVSPLSPLTNGPQYSTQTARVNLATTLVPLPVSGPTRVLKAGTVLVVPTHDQTLRSSYVGSKVRVDSLAADGVTVAYSQLRSNYNLVPLSGDVKTATPTEMTRFFNSFFTNPAVLNGGVNYPAGASYLKYDSVFLGDRYVAVDCQAATTDANISPCYTGVTLAARLTLGISSTSDGTTYFTGDGTFVIAEGFSMWIATAPRPVSATQSAATQYRFYFALNGNVYTGFLTRDGQPFQGSYYVPTPGTQVFLPYNIRLNQAATQGLAAAMAI